MTSTYHFPFAPFIRVSAGVLLGLVLGVVALLAVAVA